MDVEAQVEGEGGRAGASAAASPAGDSAMDVEGDGNAGEGAGEDGGDEEGGSIEVDGEREQQEETESTKHLSFLFEALEVGLLGSFLGRFWFGCVGLG